jgi:hypothetical protein
VADDADPGDARSVGDPVALRAGYERLRERVLAGRPDGWRLGHAALTRGGVAGWIAASAGEIVAVLCGMALAHAA